MFSSSRLRAKWRLHDLRHASLCGSQGAFPTGRVALKDLTVHENDASSATEDKTSMSSLTLAQRKRLKPN
jgi:hypothetical protein